jgi:proline racemase
LEFLCRPPAGRVTARPHLAGDRVARVSFVNVPSFVLTDTITIESLIGTRFDVRVVETTRVGDLPEV